MRLVVDLDGVALEFTEPHAGGPYPWLTSVGTLLLAVRAGQIEGLGVGETANVPVEIDNHNRQAATLLGRPLRAHAELFDDDEQPFFAGLVQSVTYGRTLTLQIED